MSRIKNLVSSICLVLVSLCLGPWSSARAAGDSRLREASSFDLNSDFYRARDIAVDVSGNIYVLGLLKGGEGKVVVYGPDGARKLSFGEGHLYSSTRMTLVRERVVIYDLVSRDPASPNHFLNGALQLFSTEGRFEKSIQIPADHQEISDMDQGSDGMLWTVHHHTKRGENRTALLVDKIDLVGGRILATYPAGSFPASQAVSLNTGFVPEMYAPVDHLVATSDGSIVVGRSQNSTVLVLGTNGSVKANVILLRRRTQPLPEHQRQDMAEVSARYAKDGVQFEPETTKSTFAALAIDKAGHLVVPSWEMNETGLCTSDVFALSGSRIGTLTSPHELSTVVRFAGDRAYDLSFEKGAGYRLMIYTVE